MLNTSLFLTDADPVIRQEFLDDIIHNFEQEQMMNLQVMTALYAENEAMEQEVTNF